MLKFEAATICYNLVVPSDGSWMDMNTSKGYMRLDNNKCECKHLVGYIVAGAPSFPYYFLRDRDCLYLMKEEPIFYK